MTTKTRLCELCEMNPPHDLTEDGDVAYLPVPEALLGGKLCGDCQQQCDAWDRDARRHKEENHAAPWMGNNCEMCSMTSYEEDRARNWENHLARCKECQQSPHDFVTAPPRCRQCGVEEGAVGAPSVCVESYTREMHRDNC